MASRSGNERTPGWRIAAGLLLATWLAIATAPPSALAESDRSRLSEKPRQIPANQGADDQPASENAGPAPVEIQPMAPGESSTRAVEGGDLAPIIAGSEEPDLGAPLQTLQPPPGQDTAFPQAPSGAVALPSIAPAPAGSPQIAGSPLPPGLWRGLEASEVERNFAKLSVPPKSPTLHALWRQLLGDEPDGGAPAQLAALRLEGLVRSGLMAQAGELARQIDQTRADPLLLSSLIRTHLALGATREACAAVKRLPLKDTKLNKSVRSEGLAVAAFCAASSKDPEAAKLGAKVLAGAGIEAPVGRAVLDALANGSRPVLPTEGAVTLVDQALLRLVAPLESPEIFARATPDAAYAAARDEAADPLARAFAGEAAARQLVLDAGELAALYQAVQIGSEDRQNPLASALEGAAKRALLYQATISERSPLRKARNARAFLDEARRDGLHMVAAAMLADDIADLPLSPEIAWFAETAVEIDLAAGRYRPAAAWAEFGSTVEGERPDALLHWLVLVDIADANGGFKHGSSLRHAEAKALSGGFPPELLQRLASVLDALQYDIPIPLWEAASREGQSEKGNLPDTGVLTELQQAAIKGEIGRVILLSLRALGPDGAENAHLLALGDTIRSLKAAGLEVEARRLALEALFEDWPRRTSG